MKVHRPLWFSFGKVNIFGFSTMHLSAFTFKKAVEKTLRGIRDIDVLYAHFLAPAGVTAAELGEKYGIPAFCAFGESGLWSIDYLKKSTVRKTLSKLSGVISVSSNNKQVLLDNGIIEDPSKIRVFPNGCDTSIFYPRDRDASRKALGIPEGLRVGIFVGSFIERKGPLRVDAASSDIENLKMIYIGAGSQKPTGSNVIYCGRVEHDQIPQYFSAADFFVLPTKGEGCCNAIVEAMACGLPIISSDRPFNSDILDETNAIRIDPENIGALHEAMAKLSENDDLRDRMSAASLKKAEALAIEERAKAIMEYILE